MVWQKQGIMTDRKIESKDIIVVVGRSAGIGELRINNYDRPYLYKEAEKLKEQILNDRKIVEAVTNLVNLDANIIDVCNSPQENTDLNNKIKNGLKKIIEQAVKN